MNPRVQFVTATDDYKLQLVFSNGEHGIYDCSHLLDFGVFKELRDQHYFKRVKAVHGTVVWPHNQDICPDTLYLESQKIPHKKYKAQVRMTQYRQVEFELPDDVDRHTVEVQAQREASQQYGEADEIEVIKVENV